MALYDRSSAPVCHDSRPCFGRDEYRDQRRCRVLNGGYQADGECPFCKPEQFYTNGKHYPINPLIKPDKPETRDRRKKKGVTADVAEG